MYTRGQKVFLLFLALCLISLLSQAAPVSVPVASKVALNAAANPGIRTATTQTQETVKASAVCFWETPGSQRWVNLYALVTVYVVEDRHMNDRKYFTLLDFNPGSSSDDIRLPIIPSSDTRVHFLAIQKRLEECREGK